MRIERANVFPCTIGVEKDGILIAAVNCMQPWRAADIAKQVKGNVEALSEEPSSFEWILATYEAVVVPKFMVNVMTNDFSILKPIWLESYDVRGTLIINDSRNYIAGSSWEKSNSDFDWQEIRRKDVFNVPIHRRLFGGHLQEDAAGFFDRIKVWAYEQ